MTLAVNPNPAESFINISYNLTETSNVNIFVFDLQSRLIQQVHTGLQVSGKYQFDLNISSLEAGIYLLMLQTQTNTVTKKIFVSR